MPGPLSRLRVLDLSRVQAGPGRGSCWPACLDDAQGRDAAASASIACPANG